MIDDIKDFVCEVVFPVGALCALAVIGFLALYASVDYLDCTGFGSATEHQVRWRWACYVQTENGWVPKDYVYGNAHELRIKDKK